MRRSPSSAAASRGSARSSDSIVMYENVTPPPAHKTSRGYQWMLAQASDRRGLRAYSLEGRRVRFREPRVGQEFALAMPDPIRQAPVSGAFPVAGGICTRDLRVMSRCLLGELRQAPLGSATLQQLRSDHVSSRGQRLSQWSSAPCETWALSIHRPRHCDECAESRYVRLSLAFA